MKNTSWKREVAEMTMEMIVEAMPDSKKNALKNACQRNNILTTYYGLGFSELSIYKEGYYWKAEGTRSNFAVFVKDDDGKLSVIRKPKDSKLSYLWGHSWLNEMPKAVEEEIYKG